MKFFKEKLLPRRRKRGQSTVEYILLVTGVIAVMILFLTNKSGGIQKHINNAFYESTNKMQDKQETLIDAQIDTTDPVSYPPKIGVNLNAQKLL